MPKKPVDASTLKQIRQSLQENKKSAEVVSEVQTEWLGQAFSRTQVIRWKRPSNESCAQPEVVHTVLADEPTNFLGTDTAPKPTELALAALGSCLVIGVVYHAALMGLSLDTVRIKLSAGLSRTGLLGLDKLNRPGFQWVNVDLNIDAPIPKEELQRLEEIVLATSPVLDVFRQPVEVKVNLVQTRH